MGKEILYIIISLLTAGAAVFFTRRRYQCAKLFSSAKRTAAVLLAVAGISILFGWILPQRISFWLGDLRVWIVLFCLTGAAMTDLDSRTIPNLFSLIELVGFGIIIFLQIFVQRDTVLSYLTGGLIAAGIIFAFLAVIRKLARGGLGFGDIKFLTCMGLLVGIYGMIHVLIIAEVCALAVSVVLLILKKITITGTIPFAPFFLIGFVVTVVLGLL